MKKLNYRVTCDYSPFREWIVEAESESEARLQVVALTGTPYEHTDAGRVEEVQQ